MKNEFDRLSDFDIDRTIGGLALLKVNYIGNVLANNILDSAIKYLKDYKETSSNQKKNVCQYIKEWIAESENDI